MSDILYFIDGDEIDIEKLLKSLRYNDTKNETDYMSIQIAKYIMQKIDLKVTEIKNKYISSLKDPDTIKMAKSLNVENTLNHFTKVFEKELKIEK